LPEFAACFSANSSTFQLFAPIKLSVSGSLGGHATVPEEVNWKREDTFEMNILGILLWGFVATVMLTTIMSASQGLGLTRISIPFLVGTMLTPDRDRAMVVGAGVHFCNGWLFAFVYAFAFESWQQATWWLGGMVGLVHALFVLTVLMPIIPGMHPRMVSEYYGPSPNRQLQPPGFFALNYGYRTPLVALLAHAAYGITLGAFYQLAHH